ncbi:MAG: WD40 repeat domain-containing protein, partial [Gemmataceae bacterium]
DSVTGALTTPDGKLVVTASADKTIRVWEALTGKLLRLLPALNQPITALAIRPDGLQMASATDDGLLKLWDLTTVDEHTAVTDSKEPLWASVIHPDGQRIAAAGADRTIRISNRRGKTLATLSGHTAAVTSLVFLGPDKLASGSGESNIKIWDLKTNKVIQELVGHKLAVLALATNAAGDKLFSASADKSMIAWDLSTGKPQQTWNGQSLLTALALRPDGQELAVGAANGMLTLLDVQKAPTVLVSLPTHISGVGALAYSPTGDRLGTAGGDGLAKIWDVRKATELSVICKYQSPSKSTNTGSISSLSAIDFSPDGKQVLCAGADGIIHILDAMTGNVVRELRGHTDWITAAQFSANADRIVSVGADQTVRAFELIRSEFVQKVGHLRKTNQVAVDPTGKFLVSVSDD